MGLLAEDLLLLMVDDESGRVLLDGTRLDVALGGAVLLELALAERVSVEKGHGLFARAKVVALDPSPPSDTLLAEALAVVQSKPRTPQDLVTRLGKGVRPRLLGRLEDRGVLHRQQGKVLGLFPRNRWPSDDVRHEDALRDRLRGVLVTGLSVDERTSALIALLSAVDKAHTVVPGLDRRQRRTAKARAKQLAKGAWAADAVRRAIEATVAATAAAAAGAAAVTGGSS